MTMIKLMTMVAVLVRVIYGGDDVNNGDEDDKPDDDNSMG